MFQPGSVIAGRYQVVRLVGQGGMSNLYLAYDRKYNGATVVIKEMTASYSDPKEQQMAVDLFHREAKLLASLNHRHIPKVYDYFQFAGKYYLSMEFIDGEDLAEKLERTKGPLDERQVLEWGEQIATVLFYLHKHEPPIVFRDVKPSNIMLCDQGVKLIDFGIARHFDQAKKGDTMRIGSPGYAPPEQYAAQTDPRSDIYALGVTLHHALTGRDPTATQTPFLVPPARDINPNLSEATAEMLARATQLDPADRYQSVLDLKKDIKQILNRGKQSTRVVSAPTAPVTSQPTSAPAGAAPAASPNPAGAPAAAPGAAAAAPVGGTGGQPAAGTGQPAAVPAAATPVGKKKRKRPGVLLLVATVCLVVGGFALADPEQRETALKWGRDWGESLVSDIGLSNGPEERLRRALTSGDPTALLPLIDSDDLTGLSEEKQALFRLNLLAAGASKGPMRVVHLLYPAEFKDQTSESQLWQGAAGALSAVNGQGGLGRELLVVLPQPYDKDRLDFTLRRIREEESSDKRSFLVVDPAGEMSQVSEKSGIFTLTAPDQEPTPNSLPSMLDKPDFARLFDSDALSKAESLLWSIDGDPPSSGESVPTPKTAQDLEKLLERSQSDNVPLVLALPSRPELSTTSQAGKVLLLAANDIHLPPLGLSLSGEALVLESSFSGSKADLALQPRGQVSVAEARVIDACILSTLTPDQTYQGMTIHRSEDGQLHLNQPILYRWTTNGWSPILESEKTR